jgi:hypothetical protein
MKLVVTAVAAAALLFGSVATGLAKSGHAKGHAGGSAHISRTPVSSHSNVHARVGTRHRAHVAARGNVHAPGQQMKLHGSVAGYPGASGYAPGHLMQKNGSVAGHPGASGYTPGHLRETTGAGVRIR